MSSARTSDEKLGRIVRGEVSHDFPPGALTPWTFKGILANGVVALARIGAALERIADQREGRP